jgi:hypothetical protein
MCSYPEKQIAVFGLLEASEIDPEWEGCCFVVFFIREGLMLLGCWGICKTFIASDFFHVYLLFYFP